MSPIEHYFENLLDMGSDIKGEPNKNALSREVQEAIEICADYVKYDLLLDNTKTNMMAMLEELKKEIKELDTYDIERVHGLIENGYISKEVENLIQQRIDKLKENINK